MADAAESIGILQFSLDSLVQQQQAIANNIANVNTPGYQATKVTFASSLAAAMSNGGTAVAQVVPEGLPSATDGNNVSLASEMTQMQVNSLASQTVDNALSAQFTVLSDAITG
jgi:flagellar basal-body rod protein FlgB